MIDKIIKVSNNEVTVIFDNKPPITVRSDNGCAMHLIEYLLSPRNDMTYSQYLYAESIADRDTDIVYLE
jgi:hypothetical protein